MTPRLKAAATLAAACMTGVSLAGQAPPPSRAVFDEAAAARFADLALACVHQEYPNKIAHVLNGDADVRPPRELTPAFYGCYDWHSSVHGHWLLARLARTFPDCAVRPARPRRSRPEPHGGKRRRSRPAMFPVPAGRASSAPTAWRGCCSSPPSCASGRTRRRSSGPRCCARSRPPPPRA